MQSPGSMASRDPSSGSDSEMRERRSYSHTSKSSPIWSQSHLKGREGVSALLHATRRRWASSALDDADGGRVAAQVQLLGLHAHEDA